MTVKQLNFASIAILMFVLTNSCNSQENKQQSCDSNPFFARSMSTDGKRAHRDTSDFFYFLASSNLRDALKKLNINEQDVVKGEIFFSTLYDSVSKIDKYKVYRLQEWLGNTRNSYLVNLVMGVYNATNSASDENRCMNLVSEIEFDYLKFYSSLDSSKRVNQLRKIEDHLTRNTNSQRLRYLKASMDFDLGNYTTALSEFWELLNDEYYEVEILNKLLTFYIDGNPDSLRGYSQLLLSRFPSNCNLGLLYDSVNWSDKNLFLRECDKCLRSIRVSDSIRAQVAACRFFLNLRNFDTVSNFFRNYEKNNTKIGDDEVKLWERGEYYDCLLRSQFLQGKYEELYRFVILKVGYNRKIVVDDYEGFKALVRRYYMWYRDTNPKKFELFFETEFRFLKGTSHKWRPISI